MGFLWFNPGLALIGVCGTQFNRVLNFNPGLGDLTWVSANRGFEEPGPDDQLEKYILQSTEVACIQ